MSGVPQWPGDADGLTYQTLSFNSSINTLTLTPFGNTVSLNAASYSNVSSINGTPIPTYQGVGFSNLSPGSNPFVIGSNSTSFPIFTFSNLVAGAVYRIGFSATFADVQSNAVNSNGYLTLGGYGGPGNPGGTVSIASINAQSWVHQPGNTPGTAGAAAAFYVGMFQPPTPLYIINADTYGLSNDVSMFINPVYLERLL